MWNTGKVIECYMISCFYGNDCFVYCDHSVVTSCPRVPEVIQQQTADRGENKAADAGAADADSGSQGASLFEVVAD